MNNRLIVVVLLAFTLGLAVTGYAQDQEEKPPPNALRITGEALAGGVGGIALGSLLAYLGEYVPPEDIFIPAFAAVGADFGSTTGVCIIGSIGDETGSYWAALLGSALGSGIAFLCTVPFYLIEGTVHPVVVLGICNYTFSTVGATIGFNMTRRYKTGR